MNHFLRPCRPSYLSLVALAGIGSVLAGSPAAAHAQAQQITPVFQDSSTRAATPAQGYLGVDIEDVSATKLQTLKLKDIHGAVITLIDHDAPAGQVGLRINDVVLQIDGQIVENADQFRRIMKDLPPGRKVTLQISRDGTQQTMSVQLVDRKQMEQSVWHKLGTATQVPEMGILSGDTLPSGFHLPSFGSTLKVGALVEPLTAQMAASLGVESGLMVKEVAHRSEAEKSGLRVFDVILKVGGDSVATSADWDRALRANQGKPVQVTILRDKRQQTLKLQVDSKHQKGAFKQPLLTDCCDHELMAALNSEFNEKLVEQISAEAEAAAQAAQQQADAMRAEMRNMQLALNPMTDRQLRHETEQLRKSLKALKANPQQMQDLRRQLEKFCEQMEEWSARAEGRFV